MPRPITDVLRDVRAGRAVVQASDMLAELVKAIDETGKKGTLTLKLTITPEEDGGAQKTIEVDVSMKKPTPTISKSVFFSTDDGDLLRTDPAQKEMFKEAEGGAEKRVAPAAV